MPEYLSAEALLADARLRVDGFRGDLGVLVVEGPDDKRLFYSRVEHPSQILATGGRRLLLSSYEKASKDDFGSIVFFTDCDYAVRRGELSGGRPGLVITVGTTVESDILSLGTLEPVVMEIVPSAVSSKQLAQTCIEILRLATIVALPIGRMRMAIQPLGVDVGLDEIDISKFLIKKGSNFNTEKLITVVRHKLRQNGVDVDLEPLFSKTPPDERMCNGKDLLRAIRYILHSKYKVANDITDTILCKMLRLAVSESAFENWAVIRRIRNWESVTGKRILLRPRRPPDNTI